MTDDRPAPVPPMGGLRFDGYDEHDAPKWSTSTLEQQAALAASGPLPAERPGGGAKVAGPPGSGNEPAVHRPAPAGRPPHSFTPEPPGGVNPLNTRRAVYSRDAGAAKYRR